MNKINEIKAYKFQNKGDFFFKQYGQDIKQQFTDSTDQMNTLGGSENCFTLTYV